MHIMTDDEIFEQANRNTKNLTPEYYKPPNSHNVLPLLEELEKLRAWATEKGFTDKDATKILQKQAVQNHDETLKEEIYKLKQQRAQMTKAEKQSWELFTQVLKPYIGDAECDYGHKLRDDDNPNQPQALTILEFVKSELKAMPNEKALANPEQFMREIVEIYSEAKLTYMDDRYATAEGDENFNQSNRWFKVLVTLKRA